MNCSQLICTTESGEVTSSRAVASLAQCHAGGSSQPSSRPPEPRPPFPRLSRLTSTTSQGRELRQPASRVQPLHCLVGAGAQGLERSSIRFSGGLLRLVRQLTDCGRNHQRWRRPSFPALILQPAPKAACADKAYQRQTNRVRAEVDQHLHARHGCRAEKHRSNDPIEGAGFLKHLPLRHRV